VDPFDLRGSQFLLFYSLLSACILGTAWFLRRQREAGAPPQLDLSDPYLIAYLRGGINEALRLATLSLIDRGILNVSGDYVSSSAKASPEILHHEIEKQVQNWFRIERRATTIFGEYSFFAIRQDYDRKLLDLGLKPDADLRSYRAKLVVTACIVLVVVAAVKAAIALARGRTNLIFLALLTAASCIAVAAVCTPARTMRGDAVLKDLCMLFADLRQRKNLIRPGGATKEMSWLAAVFGLAMLPADQFPYARKLYRRAVSDSGWNYGGYSYGSSCSSACGATCGSDAGSSSSFSCGSGCGSGCGGGGCGGGCGGCGS
jgi:uncharacterized protein (TIGR04222 family)